mmetsp:Transcript_9268/g.21975  ORF Transcript_9268/g.21975 Transcript_9268/m.21975 type:complete len:108 (+) Transcript_9268:320-643(+)
MRGRRCYPELREDIGAGVSGGRSEDERCSYPGQAPSDLSREPKRFCLGRRLFRDAYEHASGCPAEGLYLAVTRGDHPRRSLIRNNQTTTRNRENALGCGGLRGGSGF